MSRKTTNLRKRLRIVQDMAHKLVGQKKRAQDDSNADRLKLLAEIASLTKTVQQLQNEIKVHEELKHLTVHVPPPSAFKMHQLVITFQPEAFMYGARMMGGRTREFEDMSRLIYNISHEAQYKVQRKMQEVLAGEVR